MVNRITVNPDATIKELFLSLCIPDSSTGCWVWIGARHSSAGYGEFWLGFEHCLAHRASWWVHHNVWPGPLCVLHKCHNRLCVNPDHLYLGTKKDNARDTIQSGHFVSNKGRKRTLEATLAISGERNYQCKLTREKVLEFRSKVACSPNPTATTREYAKLFGVCYATMWSVWHRESWKHV